MPEQDIETTLAGKLKILTIALGAIAVTLISGTHSDPINDNVAIRLDNNKVKEDCFFGISITALLISFLLVTLTIFDLPRRIHPVSVWKFIDMGYHFLMAVLLLIGWILFVISVANRDKVYRKAVPSYLRKQAGYNGFMAKRSFELIFQLINTVVYAAIGVLIIRNRNET